MVLNSPKEDRSTVVCAPCGNGSPALNYIHNDDKTKQFYLAKGKITVKLNVTEEFRYLKLISPTKDIMPMESKEETMDSVKWKNMGVRIKMEAQIRFDTVIQEINFSYELVRTNEEGKLCADGSADIFFSIANGFKSIDIKCFIHDVTLMPVFTIPQFVNYLQYIFVNCSDDTDPSSTCMVFMFGGFLSACVRTYIVRTYQDHGLFLCSAFYNIYDEDSGIIDFVFADVLWTALEFEGDYYSARLQMIETIDSATNKTIHKMVIGLPCFPNTSPICDAGLPHSRPDTDVPEIPKRSCIKGVVDGKRIIADGLVGYCKYEGGDDFSINDTSYPGEACFQITENLKAYCKPNFEKGKCECCCVNDEKECNAEFTENNLYYSLYLTCQESLRHGEHEPFYTNIKAFWGSWIYSPIFFFPPIDVMDVNREFEKLMGFFELDLTVLKVKDTGIFNRVMHAYNNDTTVAADSTRNTFYTKICGNIEFWDAAEISAQCKCFYSSKTVIHCCCSKTPFMKNAVVRPSG